MSSIAVGTTAVAIVPMNVKRKTITLTNRSTGGQIITLDNSLPGGLTITNGGWVLSPGAAIAFILEYDGPDITNPWSAISDVAGALLFWKETSV